MPRLIVNADDFGLTSGVNRAILELNQARVLTSATLMARAAATDEAVEMALATPTLGVGCHVVLVDGEPIQPPQQLPTLTRPGTRHFQPKLGGFVKAIFTGKVDPMEMEAEAHAQIRSLQARGLRLTHIDTHKHTHIFPQVLRPVLRAARSCGIRAVRNPFEPNWSIAATPDAPLIRLFQVRMLRILESAFRRIVAERGFVTTDGALGVVATGTLDERSVSSLLSALPSGGTYELVTHPGYNDADLASTNTRLLASRDTERQALDTLRRPHDPALAPQLISFAEL